MASRKSYFETDRVAWRLASFIVDEQDEKAPDYLRERVEIFAAHNDIQAIDYCLMLLYRVKALTQKPMRDRLI